MMIYIRSTLVLLLGLVLFSGCTSSNMDQKQSRDIQDPIYNIIKTSKYSFDIETKKEYNVYYSDTKSDLKAFEDEYQAITGQDAPSFEGSMIIAKSGEHSNGGYDISIENIQDNGRYIEVTILLQSAADECISTMALTNPYLIAELPDNHKEIRFVEKSIEIDCK